MDSEPEKQKRVHSWGEEPSHSGESSDEQAKTDQMQEDPVEGVWSSLQNTRTAPAPGDPEVKDKREYG